jgi:hypothetical protein
LADGSWDIFVPRRVKPVFTTEARMRCMVLPALGFCVLAALLAQVGCSDEGGGDYCADWCEMAVSVELEEIDDIGCDLDDDPDAFAADCKETCSSTLSGLDAPLGHARSCINCVYDEVGGSPTHEQLQDALNGACDDLCFKEGMTEFYDTFWEEWNLWDYDLDCD